jgi:hypothetical protein
MLGALDLIFTQLVARLLARRQTHLRDLPIARTLVASGSG